jgi:hypothetical protein
MGKARDYIPALQYGNKIMPEDIAGMIGLPHVGDIYYVDPYAGSDTANSGTSQDDALATVAEAYGKCTSGKHDVVVIAPTGGSGRSAETTEITWAKRFTHLIGSAAPTAQDPRAGIEFGTGGSFTLSENGCLFKNLTFTSSADIDETVSISGNYNSFLGVDFKGTYNATSADSTPWRALNINGGKENYFGSCTFGSDTMSRGAANATVEFENAASRNVFDECRFVMHNDTANTPVHVLLTGTSAIDRWIEFKNCSFYSFWTNYADKTAGVINASAQTATGDILMTGNNLAVGFDDWEGTASNRVWFPPYEAHDAGAYTGLAINNA